MRRNNWRERAGSFPPPRLSFSLPREGKARRKETAEAHKPFSYTATLTKTMHKRSHFEREYHSPSDGSPPPPFSPYGTFPPSAAVSIYPTPTSSFNGGDFCQPLGPIFDSIMPFNHVDTSPYPVSPSTLGDPLWPVATTTTGALDSCADVLLASPPFGRKNEAQEGENEDEALSLSFFRPTERSLSTHRTAGSWPRESAHDMAPRRHSPLVRAGSHFGLALDLKQLARVFADNVWVWTPLNPSMLNDDRLLQLIQPASVRRKHTTTLVLHACLALSWGSPTLRHVRPKIGKIVFTVGLARLPKTTYGPHLPNLPDHVRAGVLARCLSRWRSRPSR